MDDEARRRQRAAMQSGAVGDEIRSLSAAVRAGRLSRDQLLLAVAAGIPAACEVAGIKPYADEATAWCESHLPQPPSNLFIPVQDQVALVWGLNEKFGWGFTATDFLILAPPTEWLPSGRLPTYELFTGVDHVSMPSAIALVLVPYFEQVQRTVKQLLVALKGEQSSFTVDAMMMGAYETSDSIDFVSRGVALLDGAFHPTQRQLRWERIDLGANPQGQTKELRSPSRSPHVGVIAAAILHNNWYDALERFDLLQPSLPGIILKRGTHREEDPSHVLAFQTELGILSLVPRDFTDNAWTSVPEFV